jgi:hypothetical protein
MLEIDTTDFEYTKKLNLHVDAHFNPDFQKGPAPQAEPAAGRGTGRA